MNEGDLLRFFGRVPQESLRRIYSRHGIKPQEGIQSLADEISLDGAVLVSIFRGWDSIPYEEIVEKTASNLGVGEENEVEIFSNFVGKPVKELLSLDKDQLEELIVEKQGEIKDLLTFQERKFAYTILEIGMLKVLYGWV